MSTLECPRCGVRWDESWSRLCWVCGTLGEPSTAVNGGWRHYPEPLPEPDRLVTREETP